MTNVKCINQSMKFPNSAKPQPICKIKCKNINNKYIYNNFKYRFNQLTHNIFEYMNLPIGIKIFIVGSALLKTMATNKNIKSRKSDIDIAVHMEYLKTYSLLDIIKIFLCRKSIFKISGCKLEYNNQLYEDYHYSIILDSHLIDSIENIKYNASGAKKYILDLIKNDDKYIYLKSDLKSKNSVKIPITIISPQKIIVELKHDMILEFFQIDIPIHEVVRTFDFPPVRAVYDLKDLFVYYSAAKSHCTGIIDVPDIHKNIKLTQKKSITDRLNTYNEMFDYHIYHQDDIKLFPNLKK